MLKKQDTSENLELLAAMRYYYNKAKILHHINISVSVLVALSSIYISPWHQEIKLWIPVVAGTWALLSLLLLSLEKRCTKMAATIQEQFDTNLFEIPWNRILVGDRINPENIKKASTRIKLGKNQLTNWYVGLNSPTKELNILLAQRTNLIWDSNQRKKYSILVGIMTLVYFGFVIFYGWDMTTEKLILTIVIPSAPIIVHGFKTANSNWTRSKECDYLAKDVLQTIESDLLLSKKEITQKIRQYQDVIFQKRCDTNLIPNWWYKLWRTEGENIMKSVNEQISTRTGC